MNATATTIRADKVVAGTEIRAGYAGHPSYAVRISSVEVLGAKLVLRGTAEKDPGSAQTFMVDPSEVLFLA